MIKFHVEGDLTKLESINIKKTIQKVITAVTNHEKITGPHYISFIIVDNNEIQKINREYRKIDRPTDVITFANIDDEEGDEIPVELGDIFISWEQVIEPANEYGHSILREFAFLVTHGMLHALGYDHQNEVDESLMFGIQDEILEKLKITR